MKLRICTFFVLISVALSVEIHMPKTQAQLTYALLKVKDDLAFVCFHESPEHYTLCGTYFEQVIQSNQDSMFLEPSFVAKNIHTIYVNSAIPALREVKETFALGPESHVIVLDRGEVAHSFILTPEVTGHLANYLVSSRYRIARRLQEEPINFDVQINENLSV